MTPRQKRHWLGFAGVFGVPLVWTSLFLLIPYAVMLAVSFWTRKFPLFVPDFQFGNFRQVFADPQYLEVLLRTGKIAALVSVFALALGYPLAYFLIFIVRTAKVRNFLYMVVIVPLWVSYLLRAYVWKIILGTGGVLNSFLMWTGIIDQPSGLFLYNQTAMIITLTYIFIPFMVMPIYTALEKIPPRLIEASHDLGEGPFWTFLRVVLPLSWGGVVAGATLTFCLAFGDFVAPSLVGGPDGMLVANTVQTQFGAALNWPLGSALSTVILLLVLTIITISERSERYGKIDLD
ncbi:ABC transporter permease [Insolitispirillum peregrinum]|uniref:ABC transporter permease n=1 Tax=Insolitispirillum peregrinum TaxID=80876 RepID=UPI00360A84BA